MRTAMTFSTPSPSVILYPEELAASSPAQQALYAIQLVQHRQVHSDLEDQACGRCQLLCWTLTSRQLLC